MNYWMVKQEPEKYSFDDFLNDGKTDWTGVRNFQARQYLRAMKTGDPVLFYHSVSDKAVVGSAEVSKESFSDSTDDTGKWIAVELKPVERFAKSVTLDEIKAHPDLQNIALIKQSRLSVMPLTREECEVILKLGDQM